MVLPQFFRLWIYFKTKKEIFSRPFVGSYGLKDKCSKSSSGSFLNKENKQLLQVCLIYQSSQCKMNDAKKVEIVV